MRETDVSRWLGSRLRTVSEAVLGGGREMTEGLERVGLVESAVEEAEGGARGLVNSLRRHAAIHGRHALLHALRCPHPALVLGGATKADGWSDAG